MTKSTSSFNIVYFSMIKGSKKTHLLFRSHVIRFCLDISCKGYFALEQKSCRIWINVPSASVMGHSPNDRSYIKYIFANEKASTIIQPFRLVLFVFFSRQPDIKIH